MKEFIWDNKNLSKALGVDVGFELSSKRVCTDTRKITSGDIFVALKGENFDGNRFASEAIKQGAVAAIVDDKYLYKAESSKKLIYVDDALRALQKIGKYRRKNSSAKFIGLVGSVGKSGTKEMLYTVLATRYKTYKTEGNLNNHIGLPLTLANMSDDIEYAVIEMGMNNAGEISELVRICQPNIAAVTWIGEAHIENLGSEENIARAKGEIFEWLAVGGCAVIPGDNDFHDLLHDLAESNGVTNIYSFGTSANAVLETKKGTSAHIFDEKVSIPDGVLYNQVLNNVLLVLTVASLCEVKLESAIDAINSIGRMKGRGQKILLKNGAVIIDDSYNASPTSMKLALKNLLKEDGRKIAVLGDMKELGLFTQDYHEELVEHIEGLDMVVTCGVEMKNLHKLIKYKVTSRHFETIEGAEDFLVKELKQRDVALIKGSHGSNMYKIVDMISSK